MTDAVEIAYILLSPTLWWLWESVIVFMYFTVKFMKHWGKDRHILLRRAAGVWQQLGEYWVPGTAKWFRTKSKRSFTTEPETAVFETADLSGIHKTVLHDYDYARPRRTEIASANKKGNLKATIGSKLKGLKPGEAGDPTATNFDTFAAEEVWKQGLKANALGHPDLLSIVMFIAMGAMAGALIVYVGFPQHVPVPYPIVTTTTVTGVP